jgi:hypothetical protein
MSGRRARWSLLAVIAGLLAVSAAQLGRTPVALAAVPTTTAVPAIAPAPAGGPAPTAPGEPAPAITTASPAVPRPVPTVPPVSVTTPAPPRPPALPPPPSSGFLHTCGTRLCFGSNVFAMYGATVYGSTSKSGVDNPDGAVELALLEGFTTMRVVNFYNPTTGDPATTPFSDAVWSRVDTLIAKADAANLKVVLDLADYRNILLDHCINPYRADWTRFETFVAHRVNHVSGRVYGADPAIAMVSFAGEPEPVGTHGCISYTAADLTTFFRTVTRTWKSLDRNHLTTSGGLGYLDFTSGIDWHAITSDPNLDVCAFKTYGGMKAWLPAGASYCNGTLAKPWYNDEWGYQQSAGDAATAQAFQAQFDSNRANNAAGNFFWNAGYETAPGSYDVGPQTPLTLAVVRLNAVLSS